MELSNEREEFGCPDCGHTAMVAGGEGVMLSGVTTTIVCNTCRELCDAIVWRRQNHIYVEPHCPKGDDHPVAVWTFPGTCAKCGAQMRKTGIVALID